MFSAKSLYSLIFLIPAIVARGQQSGASLSHTTRFAYNKQKPVSVPVISPLSRATPYFDGGLSGKLPDSTDYRPGGNGSFVKHNGKSEKKFVITTGVWRLLAGDKPIIGLELRDTSGAYAKPALLPHLGVKGTIRLEVIAGQSKKFLENFSSVTCILTAGQPAWRCEDDELGLKILLTAFPFTENYGCALTLAIEAKHAGDVKLDWHYDDARFATATPDACEFSYDRYTRIFTGSVNQKSICGDGIIRTPLSLISGQPASDTLICLWGYTGYDTAAVDKAFQRLRFRPFSSMQWVEAMKKKWFHHWIGRGLEPEEKFVAARQNASQSVEESRHYWESMQSRVIVKTGDSLFDNVVQSLGSRLISNYEYPAFTHGSNYMKYGKINCGLYGMDAAGLHEEVASTLQFIAGSQDVKGRQRYFEPVFTISQWAEEINPFFVEQVWYHYRWTGDKDFLIAMWPSVRRALEHFIATSDPLHTGYFTGYYENWNGDGKSRGGSGALWTAMGIKALQAGYEIAALLEDEDWSREIFQVTDNHTLENDFRSRYKRLLLKAEAAYETRYNKKIGAYSSSEWNAELRNMPGNEESNYAIWREIGDPLRNYTSLRFIRDNYHQTAPNGVIEFSNKDWPVCWSNHYDSYAEAMSSVASAAMTNDINHYWPLLKTACDKIYTIPECTAIAGGRSQLSLESDQMFMMAVLDNIFGIKPYFGKNLLIIRPSFPDAWKNPEITLPDLSYRYTSTDTSINLSVHTLAKRLLQVELPLKKPVRQVLVNGQQVTFEIKAEVNFCRVIIHCDSASLHNIQVIFSGTAVAIDGTIDITPGTTANFTVRGAEILQVLTTQEGFGKISSTVNSVSVTPETPGNYTVFAQLKNGNVSWYQPIELTVRDLWTIDEEYRAWEEETPGQSKAAELLSPCLDEKKQSLRFRLSNHTSQLLSGKMELVINGHSIFQQVTLQAALISNFEIPLKNLWPLLSRGTFSFKIKFAGQSHFSHSVNWSIPLSPPADKQTIPVDLRDDYNISLQDLYSNHSFKWRIDYTGAAVGVDWRDTLYSDKLGYKLFSPPTSVISYGVLPEQMSPSWWSVPFIPDSLRYPVPFDFIEHGSSKKNVLALVNAENSGGIPSEAALTFRQPVAAEKIYLLTANLTKPCKSYYPSAEVEIQYTNGTRQLVQLIPPYSMPSMIQAFCPDEFRIPIGVIENKQIMDFGSPGLSVTDIVTDPSLRINKLTFRCVASETSFAIIGLTILKPVNPRK